MGFSRHFNYTICRFYGITAHLHPFILQIDTFDHKRWEDEERLFKKSCWTNWNFTLSPPKTHMFTLCMFSTYWQVDKVLPDSSKNPNTYCHENSLHFSPIFSSLCIMYAKRAEIRADLEIDFEIWSQHILYTTNLLTIFELNIKYLRR